MWTITLLVALASAPLALADSAMVFNKCSFPIYLWSVSDVSGPMVSISPGANYSEVYHVNPNGGGISLKVSPTTTQTAVTQFEYTLDTESLPEGKLWFDLSNVNGAPFAATNLLLDSPNGSCQSVVCPAGATSCKQAYTKPSDNFATHACTFAADLVLSVCANTERVAKVVEATAAQKRETDIEAERAEEAVIEAVKPRHVHAHVGRSRLFRL